MEDQQPKGTPVETAKPPSQPKQPARSARDALSWSKRFDKLFVKLELFGVRAANKVHRGFVNCVLLFIFYNMYVFVSNYNSYWRLRRDPNVPK